MTADEQDILRMAGEEYRALKETGRELRPQDRLSEDLEIDSLTAVELLSALEDRLGVEVIDDPRLVGVRTAGDLADLLARLVRASASIDPA